MARRKLSQKDVLVAYGRLFSSPEGEVVLDDLRQQFCYDRSTIPATFVNDVPINAVLLNEGMRRAYLYIQSKLEEAEADGRRKRGAAAESAESAELGLERSATE